MPTTPASEVEGRRCALCGADATHIYGDMHVCCQCHQNGFQETINAEDCDELMDMLTGKDLPEGMAMRHQPSLSRQQGFSVIWFLQEHMHLLPDNIEMCSVCEELFDHGCEGFIVDGTDTPDGWHKEHGITKKMLEQNDGTMFCSAGCEQQY